MLKHTVLYMEVMVLFKLCHSAHQSSCVAANCMIIALGYFSLLFFPPPQLVRFHNRTSNPVQDGAVSLTC